MKSISLSFLLLVLVCFTAQTQNLQPEIYKDTIPFGGNAWVDAPAEITDEGLINWNNASSVAHIYFRVDVPQTFDISLRLQTSNGKSEISLSAGNIIFKKQIAFPGFGVVHIGKLAVTKAGYIKIDLKGISKTGSVFANVSDLIIQYAKKDTGLVYVKNGSSFHFGRRGPSVHLNFIVPDEIKNDVHWFYNEITIPVGMDKLGSYFMADGFNGGYFGMQVNSATERRIIFSVWSPFETDDPKAIPDSLRIKLVKKGRATDASDFGGEGSGGHSHMPFMWQAGKTYGFLLHAEIDSTHQSTIYTAYFKDISAGKWYLIASFKRPQTEMYLTHLYSFLENFIPETGDATRMGFYKNQWITNNKGEWLELTNARFTFDATAKGGYRKDYAGGAEGDHFFLKNAGFFNEFVPASQVFTRSPSGKKPVIDFNALPNQ